jgi:RNA polymerase sigma factor (sigma-70 family)
VNQPVERSAETDLDEREIVIRARRGDEAAWLEIVALHQQGVFRMAYLKLGDGQEAEDVAQETFVRAFRKLDQFDPTRPLRPWLLGICANLCRNHWRAIARYLTAVRRWSRKRGTAAAAARPEPAGEADRLWSLIRKMDDNDQDVLHYRFFMELTVEEAADVMRVAPGTVKSRQHRAIKRLRGLIERHASEWLEDLQS